MKISELMTRGVKTCCATDSLDRAAQLMWEHDIGTVVVVDDSGQVIGMVTDRDACMAAYTSGEPLRDILVDRAMSRHVVTCTVNDTEDAVAALMAKHKIRRLPVVDEVNHPIGLVSLNDLARATGARRPVPASAVAGTLAAICEHRVEQPAAHAAS